MLTRTYIYRKQIKGRGYTEEYILLVGNGVEVFDAYTVDQPNKVAKRWRPEEVNWTVRGALPLLLGAYKQVELKDVDGFLMNVALDALQTQSV